MVGGSKAPKHHHASMQVLADTKGRSRFVWTIEVTPDELAVPINEMAEQGSRIMRETLKAAPAPAGR